MLDLVRHVLPKTCPCRLLETLRHEKYASIDHASNCALKVHDDPDLITSGNSETFTYTPRENLTTATGPYGALAYTYDGVGNRLTANLRIATDTDTDTYPATSNRLTTITLATGGSRGYTYDTAGNVTAEARTGGPCACATNATGRMSHFRINGVLQASYQYDAMG